MVKTVISMQRVQVQSLAAKLISHMWCSQKLKQINKFKGKIFFFKWWRQIINYLHGIKKYWEACGEESEWTDMLCEWMSHGTSLLQLEFLILFRNILWLPCRLKKNSNNKTPHKRERLGCSGMSLGCEEAGGERRKAVETGWGGRSPHSQPLGN